MKKVFQATIFIAVSAMLTSAPAFADGLVFDPQSYPVSKAENQAIYTGSKYQTSSVYAAEPVNTKAVTDISNQTSRQNTNMQNALFQLDSAQTDIRNQLLDARAKYVEIDNQYKMIKEQRKIQKQLVKDSEKRIKDIEKTKLEIRKNMQIQ